MKTTSLPAPTTAATRNGPPAAPRRAGARAEYGPMMHDLHRRAEAQMRTQRKNQKSPAKLPRSEAGPQRLLHELQVRQIELELQNEELRKTRDDMEAGRDKYSDLYDFAPIGCLTLDREGTIAEANLAGASLLGVARAALVKRRFGAFISPADRSVFTAFLQQIFKSKAREECDVRLLVNGKDPVDVRVRGIVFNSGQACRVAVTDITEHKRAEDKVRCSEIRYRRLFETAQDGVLLLDPATRKITDANPFMTSLLGYSRAQFVGKELFEIGLLKDEAVSQEMFQKLKRNHEVRYEDLPLESRRGRHQEVEVVANLYQENGHAVIQCNIRDITARKQAEQELSEKARLLDLSHDAIIVRDVKGRIRYWNHGAEDLYGWSSEEALGKISNILFRTEYPIPEKQMMAELLRTDRWIGELVHRTRDGRRVTVLVRKTLDRDRQGRPASLLQTITDITERKQAEATQRRVEVLAASNQKLEKEIARRQTVEKALKKSGQHQRRLLAQSNRQQEQLRQLSRQILTVQEEERRTISRELHDVIAQTLTGINIRLAGLKQEAARSTKGLDQKIASTQRLVEKSVDIVHQFARELRPTVLDDLGLIPALHAFMKAFTTQTGVRASLTASAEVEHLNITQRTVLYRVAQEAFTNVARHAHASRVDVSIRKLPGHIGMKVQDDGKSFRVELTSPANGGKRLGLLGMKERLEMIGGTFTIESAPGQGTTIGAEIPIHFHRARGARMEHTATQS